MAEYQRILRKCPALCKATTNIQKELVTEEQLSYCNVFAPVLVSFIDWVLMEAVRTQKKRLYFLARDGYQMYVAARHICRERGLDLECRYLEGSRYAWRIPQFAVEGDSCIDKICLGGIDVNFKKIMRRAGLTEEEGKRIAGELGWIDQYDRILSYQEVVKLKEPLRNHQNFMALVFSHSRDTYENTIGYLEQEGLLEDVPYALVDSGWVGTLQETLQQLLQSAGYAKKLEGFYFGLYETPRSQNKGIYHGFYFSPEQGLKRKVYFSNCLFESVFSAPYGMTMGYCKRGERFEPVYASERNLNHEQLSRNTVLLEKYLEEYTKCEEQYAKNSAKRTLQCMYQLLKRFMGKPTEAEVLAYGNNLFSDDVTEEFVQQVAVELSEEEIRNQFFLRKILIMLGIRKGEIRESAWLEGSIVRSRKKVGVCLLHTAWYKYVLYIRKRLKGGI